MDPRKAYTAATHGMKKDLELINKNCSSCMSSAEELEDIISNVCTPAISNGRCSNSVQRNMLELSPRMGGLWYPYPNEHGTRRIPHMSLDLQPLKMTDNYSV